ncbi:sporulation membrane protein YtrI [Virgibacillus sp. W0430]|uniref:sporulation membrane protein YtrI n=1 Tax=Virgibacillus sp. W0430 TaxID=3391580 RepID=UPI003F479F18
MHIPPYYKNKSWQYFFVGILFGSVLSYFIFILMYGTMYEQLLEENLEIQLKLSELESQNEALLQDKKDLDEKSKNALTIESIDITISNATDLRFDRLITHQFEVLIKEEINHIVGRDIHTVSENDELLISTIENKAFSIDDFTYYFEVIKLSISKRVKITLKAKISN